MICPKCKSTKTDIKDSRLNKDGTRRRKRDCRDCDNRFWSVECPRGNDLNLNALDSILRGLTGELQTAKKLIVLQEKRVQAMVNALSHYRQIGQQ